MNAKSYISIVILMFKGEKFIDKQLNSIIVQTFKNYEIIVIEYWSDDNTYEVVDHFFDNLCDKNVQLIRNDENLDHEKY